MSANEINENNVWETLKNHEDYEINVNYPYQIRKKSNRRIVSESDNGKGYNRCKLNNKDFLKHRLIAEQFIPNPDNLPFIDHINRIRTDNRIENLRWISRSENNKNRTLATENSNIIYEYVDTIDDEAIEITDYGKYQFEFYYYVEKEDSFYFYNGKQYRKLHVNIQKQTNKAFVYMNDTTNNHRVVYLNNFKKLYGIDF